MRNNALKYIIICSVRNEEKYITDTLLSIINQTILPIEMIIVDDCSSDNTCEIIKKFQVKNPWLKLIHTKKRNSRKLGSRIVENFYFGLDHVTKEFDFIVKMDADISIPKNYFEYLFKKFLKNKKLGMAGGITYSRFYGVLQPENSHPEFDVPGPLKTYKKECFQDIGGLVPMLGWDHIDQAKAHIKGWDTKNFNELKIVHQRPMGSSIGSLKKGKMRWGETAYILRNDIFFVLAKGIYHIFKYPYIIGGLYFYIGYVIAFLKQKKRLSDKVLYKYMRRQQRRRLLNLIRI